MQPTSGLGCPLSLPGLTVAFSVEDLAAMLVTEFVIATRVLVTPYIAKLFLPYCIV